LAYHLEICVAKIIDDNPHRILSKKSVKGKVFLPCCKKHITRRKLIKHLELCNNNENLCVCTKCGKNNLNFSQPFTWYTTYLKKYTHKCKIESNNLQCPTCYKWRRYDIMINHILNKTCLNNKPKKIKKSEICDYCLYDFKRLNPHYEYCKVLNAYINHKEEIVHYIRQIKDELNEKLKTIDFNLPRKSGFKLSKKITGKNSRDHIENIICLKRKTKKLPPKNFVLSWLYNNYSKQSTSEGRIEIRNSINKIINKCDLLFHKEIDKPLIEKFRKLDIVLDSSIECGEAIMNIPIENIHSIRKSKTINSEPISEADTKYLIQVDNELLSNQSTVCISNKQINKTKHNELSSTDFIGKKRNIVKTLIF
jgi:hypothetical protein